MATSTLVKRRDSASTLASFHLRAPRAVSASTHSAARTPGTLFAAMLTPVPVQQQTTPRSAAPDATATMTAVTDLDDRSEAFNTFVAMLSTAQLFPATQLPDTAELLRFELQTLGARSLPEPSRGGR